MTASTCEDSAASGGSCRSPTPPSSAGYLAIIGFPLATGYFTKDKIIEAAFDKGGISGWVLGLVALLGAGLTAFYMTRALVMTFFGERRWEEDVHPHEAPPIMTVPMIILAVLSLIGGFLLILGGGPALDDAVGRAIGRGGGAHDLAGRADRAHLDGCRCWASPGRGWPSARHPVPVVQPVGSPVTVAVRQNLYADAFNESVLMRPGQWLTRALVFLDNRGVDGVGERRGRRLRRHVIPSAAMQTGFVRSYALSMLGGSIAVVAVLLAVRFA